MTDDIHSCGLYCDLPACIKRQRDEYRQGLIDALPVKPADTLGPGTSDRQMLTTLNYEMEHSTYECEKCGASDELKTLDIASMLRDHLKRAQPVQPTPVAQAEPSNADSRDAERFRWLIEFAFVSECFTDDGTILKIQNTDRRVIKGGSVREAIDAAIAKDATP